MPANILVIVIDGLRASALGAYGNTSFATPALDRFAAESLLLDWCYAPSADLPDIYRALWYSQHAVRPIDSTAQKNSTSRKAGGRSSFSLAKLFADLGYTTTLVTDERLLISFTGASDFDDVVHVTNLDTTAISERADDPSDTCLSRAFSAALTQVDAARADMPHLVWFHTRGLCGPWDAPLAFQQSLLDEGDPPPVESVTPPDFEVKPDNDPDAIFRHACAYAAQVMVIDARCENLLDAIHAAGSNEWLVMLIGARGFPLGEHRRIGGVDSRLYAEQLHVPWLIRFPDKVGALVRSSMLTSHHDLLPTLIDWIDRGHSFDRSAFDGLSVLPLAATARTNWRDAIISTSSTARAIRTVAWCLREDLAASGSSAPSGGETSPPELYVRPDDRWEANDVAKLCPEVVEELRALFIGHSASESC